MKIHLSLTLTAALSCLVSLSSYAQWVPVNGPFASEVLSLYNADGKIFAGTIHGLFISVDSGESWTGTPLSDAVTSLTCSGNTLFAAGGLAYRSLDHGLTWTASTPGMATSAVISLLSIGDSIIAGTFGHVFLSTDTGTTWTELGSGLPYTIVNSLAAAPDGAGNEIFAGMGKFIGTSGEGVYLLSGVNGSWMRMDSGMTNHDVRTLLADHGGLFAGTYGGGVFRSGNYGKTWSQANSGFGSAVVFTLRSGIGEGGVARLFAGAGDGLYLSTDAGESWTLFDSGLGRIPVLSLNIKTDSSSTDMAMLAGSLHGEVFRSTDHGASWGQLTSGLTQDETVASISANGSNVFAGTFDGGIFHSTNNGIQWAQFSPVQTNIPVLSLAYEASIAGDPHVFAGTFSEGAFSSTDDGTTWTLASSGLDYWVHCFAISSFQLEANTILAGTNSGVYASTNDGASWTTLGLHNHVVVSLALPPPSETPGDTLIYAGTGESGVFRSSDKGKSWTEVNSGLGDSTIKSLLVVQNTGGPIELFAGTFYGGVFRSTDRGDSWEAVDSGLTDTRANCFAADRVGGGTVLVAGTNGGVFISTNSGTHWKAVNEGMTSMHVSSLAMSDTFLYAGTEGGIWRRPLSEIITSVNPSGKILPREFMLYQNYPNPFNPATNISFELPTEAFVTLSIYDILGRRVALLLSGPSSPGSHELTFSPTGLSSGVYFCRLIAEPTAQSSPMKGRVWIETNKLVYQR